MQGTISSYTNFVSYLIFFFASLWLVWFLTELHPHIPCHFPPQPSARVSQTLRPSYHSHMIAAATSADEYWHLHHSGWRNILTSAQTTSRKLSTCDISKGSLRRPAPEDGEFVEWILLHLDILEEFHMPMYEEDSACNDMTVRQDVAPTHLHIVDREGLGLTFFTEMDRQRRSYYLVNKFPSLYNIWFLLLTVLMARYVRVTIAYHFARICRDESSCRAYNYTSHA
jgi:hypothetical protein